MNKAVLIGRIANDLELRKTQSNKAICEFSLAVNRKYNDTTDFIRVQCWNQTAEYLNQYAKKGTQIAIDGRIETSSYEKDGNKISKVYVVCDNTEILKQPSDHNNSMFGGNRSNIHESVNISQDDLPWE